MWFYCNAVWLNSIGVWRLHEEWNGLSRNNTLPNFLSCSVLFCIWMHPYNIQAALADKALGIHLEIWVTPGQQMMMKCGDWGCKPNQDWSQHINVRHMQGVWQPSYAVDVNMDVSLQHSRSPCWQSFGNSSRNLGNSWATNDGEVRWLRL